MSEAPHTIELPHPVIQVVGLSRFALENPADIQAKTEGARDAGYREGFEEAAQSARKQAEGEAQRWREDLQRILEALSVQENTLAAQMRPALLDLVLKGVRRIVATYEPDATAIEQTVTAILGEYPREESSLVVHLHPEDAKLVTHLVQDWATRFPSLRLQPDTSLHRGDCVVHGRFGVTDARLETKLDNLRTSLN